jgi:hypothetical protein
MVAATELGHGADPAEQFLDHLAFELGTEGSLTSHDKILSAPSRGPVILSVTLT